ncbi:MAG: hypothetical protein HY840_12555 [Bacteroidetes bacterium]|nr:hypothetical protein [Bacteroidota bacterium]
MSIHIGKIIDEHLDKHRISHPAFAKMIGKHKSGIWRLFLRQHLHSALLLKISEQLGHNFFQYYVADSQQENSRKAEDNTRREEDKKKIEEWQRQTLQLQKENERLLTENNLLKEMFAMLKGHEK